MKPSRTFLIKVVPRRRVRIRSRRRPESPARGAIQAGGNVERSSYTGTWRPLEAAVAGICETRGLLCRHGTYLSCTELSEDASINST